MLAKPAGEEGGSLSTALKSGVLLCELLNTVSPNAVKKVGKMNNQAVHRENIELFVGGCRKLGVDDANNFETADLYEERNLIQVRAFDQLRSSPWLPLTMAGLGLCVGVRCGGAWRRLAAWSASRTMGRRWPPRRR